VSLRAFSIIHTGPTQARKIVCRHFVPQMLQNALRDPQIPQDEKLKFSVSCPNAHFVESIPVTREHEK
jgi:hypothetical protein